MDRSSHRPETKNHSPSRLIGPPTPPPTSPYCRIEGAAVRRSARGASVRFSLDSLGPVNSPLKLPENLLPPSLGTMLICTPPVDDSAEPAAACQTTASNV